MYWSDVASSRKRDGGGRVVLDLLVLVTTQSGSKDFIDRVVCV